jgi:CubicO group peptidase (beta-lactamase class C family)
MLLGVPAARAQEVPAAQSQQALAAAIDAGIGAYYQANEPGATVIVVKDGKTVLRRAYGMADTAKGVAMTPDMALRLGSITKQFTAAGILMLAEEGKLSVDDDITKYLPGYPTQGRKITIEHLLTHTSGIVSYTSKPGYMLHMAEDLGVAQLIDSIKNDPLQFEPGSRYRYNNSGYLLLGAIIEKISGQPYAKFVEQRIFVPLGMTHTAYEGFERSQGPRAVGHTRTDTGFGAALALSMSQPYAAGALVSTVDDLARWDAAIGSGKLLKPASWKRAFTSYRLLDGKDTNYGYGWELGKLQGVPVISHGGSINGFSTYAMRLPEQHVYVAVLSNSDSGAANPAVVATRAAGITIGKPYREFREVALAPAALDGLPGSFEVEKGVQRVFRRDGNNLVMQRSGRPQITLKALSANEFFVPNTLEYFEFKRDATGAVTQVEQHATDQVLVQPRIGDVPPLRPAMKITNASFDSRVGRYQLAPSFILALSREGDRYFAQATGQPKLEIFAQDETVFFARDIEAEVRFDGADSSHLVLHQNGQLIRAPKL